jgi:hypothetical protein
MSISTSKVSGQILIRFGDWTLIAPHVDFAVLVDGPDQPVSGLENLDALVDVGHAELSLSKVRAVWWPGLVMSWSPRRLMNGTPSPSKCSAQLTAKPAISLN